MAQLISGHSQIHRGAATVRNHVPSSVSRDVFFFFATGDLLSSLVSFFLFFLVPTAVPSERYLVAVGAVLRYPVAVGA